MTKEEIFADVFNGRYLSLATFRESHPDLELVASDLYEDSHRHYSTAVDVYKVEDGFVGIEGVSRSFSEQQELTDIDYPCAAMSMKEVSRPTYVIDY